MSTANSTTTTATTAPLGGLTAARPPGPRWPRLAWRIVGTLVTLFLLGTALLQLVGLLAYNERDVEHRVDASSLDRVEIDIDSGSVEVVGLDQGGLDEGGLDGSEPGSRDLVVSGTIRSGLVRSVHDERVEGSSYVITASCASGPAADYCDTSYQLEVPEGLEVFVRVGDGDVTLRDLAGRVDASTSNSTIRADRLSGDVRLHTSNDAIRATGLRSPRAVFESSNDEVHAAFDTAPRSVRVRTSNDNVEIVVPDTPDPYAVQVRTSNGSQRVEVRTDPSSDRTIDIRTSNDDVAVLYPPG